MAAVKKLNTDYTIDTADVYVTGNLHVAGVYDTTTVTNTDVQDKDITLNVGEAGWGVGGNASPGTSGLSVDRGLQANVALRWNETSDVWELTVDGSSYNTILTSAGGGLTAVVDDTTPQLGGNLETNGFHVQFDETTYIPTATSNKTKIYADAIGSAGSGLFVVNSDTASDELVTKSKAIVFSIIL
jgi:hypothetical protein